jgi:hypothetical protein
LERYRRRIIFIAASTATESQVSGAAICTYINQFFSGGVDPSTPHRVLILVTVAAGIAVGGGIVLDELRHGKFWSLPTILVVVGIAIEAGGTIALFEFDEGISHAQEEKIIFLETRLVSLLPREQLLLGKPRDDFISKIKSFAGQKVEVRFCKQPYPVYDDEATTAAMQLASAMRNADWKSPHPIAVTGCGGEGIMMFVGSGASLDTRMAAEALKSAIAALPANIGKLDNADNFGKPVPRDPDTIVVMVLSHPL